MRHHSEEWILNEWNALLYPVICAILQVQCKYIISASKEMHTEINTAAHFTLYVLAVTTMLRRVHFDIYTHSSFIYFHFPLFCLLSFFFFFEFLLACLWWENMWDCNCIAAGNPVGDMVSIVVINFERSCTQIPDPFETVSLSLVSMRFLLPSSPSSFSSVSFSSFWYIFFLGGGWSAMSHSNSSSLFLDSIVSLLNYCLLIHRWWSPFGPVWF